jgi:hypothetical protein
MHLERRDLRRWDGARSQPILFSRPGCTRCALLRQCLAARGLTALELDIERDDRALRLLLTLAGRAWVPTVIFRHEIAVGCDAGRLEELLDTPYEPLEDFCQDDEPEDAEAEEEADVEPEPDAVVAVLPVLDVELEAR